MQIGLIQRGALRPGETLLVLGGAGGTGSAALQIGKAVGARVLTTAGGPEKVEFCRSLGADHVIDYRADIRDHTPMNRIAKASEVAEAVQFLASDAAAFMTGQIMTVDGGRTLLDPVTAPAH